MVTFSGVAFIVEAESDLGKTTIRYIVDTEFGLEMIDKLEDGQWVDRNPQQVKNALLN